MQQLNVFQCVSMCMYMFENLHSVALLPLSLHSRVFVSSHSNFDDGITSRNTTCTKYHQTLRVVIMWCPSLTFLHKRNGIPNSTSHFLFLLQSLLSLLLYPSFSPHLLYDDDNSSDDDDDDDNHYLCSTISHLFLFYHHSSSSSFPWCTFDSSSRHQVIAAEGEQRASKALREASEVIADSPAALQLRYLQTLSSIAAEKNSTIVFPVPLELFRPHYAPTGNGNDFNNGGIRSTTPGIPCRTHCDWP